MSGGRGSVEVGVGVFYMPSDTKKSASARSSGNCPEDELLVLVNEDQDILFPDCASFEFANGLGGSIKGAQITGVNNTFTAAESVNPSSTNFNIHNILYPTLFFTMPAGWTNGRSATLAARALSQSITETESWFRSNPSATPAEIQAVWMVKMKTQMGRVGGSVTTKPLFKVRSPAPYKKRFFGTGNCG